MLKTKRYCIVSILFYMAWIRKSKIEGFAKTVNDFYSLTIVAKLSILVVVSLIDSMCRNMMTRQNLVFGSILRTTS